MEEQMKNVTCSLMITLLLAFVVYAAPEDESFESNVDPILSQWGLDVVVWTQMPNATATFRRAASAQLGDYWYCFGDQYVATAHAFNLNTNTWSASTPPLVGTCNWPGIATNDHFYIVGYYNPGYGDAVQRFTPTAGGPTGVWDLMAPYPLALCGIATAWDGGDYIYAAGGGSPSTANAYRYSIAANMWTPIAPMPTVMKYCGGAWAGGKFWVIGGIENATANYGYDPVTNTWSTYAPIPIAVWFSTFSISGDGDYVYSIGGGGGYGSWPAVDAVQIYDPATNTWAYETPLPVAYGTNSSDICLGGTVGMDAGGYDGVANHAETYKGTGFAGPPPTPVTLTAFEANVVENGVLVTWNTASEIECYSWYVERNGQHVATLAGHGTTTEPQSYSYLDDVGAGEYTYTLKQVDISGQVNTMGDRTVTVGFAAEYSLAQNFPNPFNPTTTINYSLENDGFVNLSVYDLSGRTVATLVNREMTAGQHEYHFDATGLTSGVYFYKLTSGDFNAMNKMVLTK